ncbi:unnamed protein product [Schistocephalus solidus]|uniref:Uncharacterized protein n=1 Tax=Schistocephalus solidus TaxID=70667 RepID=A0A3P7CJR8_SCHSO|nr:unnamed protein product [Schistocephalus solidus]
MMWEWVHWLTGRRTRLRAPQHHLAPITRTPGFTYSGDMEEPSPSDSQSTDQPLDTHSTYTEPTAWSGRSKRVFTLMGFYFFEFGRLEEAKQFFEKSSLNVCDLLYRYVDLLPRNYTFTPSSDLNVSIAVQAQVENTPISSPNTIFDLAETLASCSKDKDPALCVRKYRIFLLEFLLEHRRSRIFEKHTQVTFVSLILGFKFLFCKSVLCQGNLRMSRFNNI